MPPATVRWLWRGSGFPAIPMAPAAPHLEGGVVQAAQILDSFATLT